MNLFLLQMGDTGKLLTDSASAALNAVTTDGHMNVFDLLYNGGVLMIPLALLLVLAIFSSLNVGWQ